MKPLSILRLVVVFLLALCSSATFASDFVTVDGFKFLVDTNKDEATLLANDYSGEVVVPASVTFEGKDYPVTTLGTECFGSSVTKVAIPNSVTTLGDKCFYNSGVKTIDIPNSVTALGDKCFYYSDIETIDIPNSVTALGNSCFEKCSNLTTIKISNSVISLGSNCFYECYHLNEVVLPSSLTEIPAWCFSRCAVNKMKIPSSVKIINGYAFYQSGVYEIEIPEGVERVGSKCFYGCDFNSIALPSSLLCIEDHVFSRCRDLKNITCKAVIPPDCNINTDKMWEEFSQLDCVLYVPQSSMEAYKNSRAWSGFGIYKAIEGENEPIIACSTPVISYENGKLNFESSTSGAEYHYTIKDGDVVTDKYNIDGNVQLAGKLDISVYATADGYMASEKTAATLYWLNAAEGETDNINLVKTRGVMVSTDNGITISGLKDGEVVTFYSVSGVNLGSAKAVQGIAHIEKPQESIVIAKINGQEIKIAVK